MSMTLLDQIASIFGGKKPKPAAPAGGGRPRAIRHQTQGFNCYLGTIVDMSSTGMKVNCDEKPQLSPGRFVEISVTSPFQRATLKTKVAWVKKLPSGWSMGFQFVDVGPALSEALDQLAKFGFAPLRQPGARRGRSEAQERADTERDYAERKSGTHVPKAIVEAAVQCTDLYAILDVPYTADEATLKSAYRRAALKLHPDVNKTPEAAEQFALVCRAYNILGDAQKRIAYDRLRLQAADAKSKSARAA